MRTLLPILLIVLCGIAFQASSQDLRIVPESLNFSWTRIDSVSTLEFTLENTGMENYPVVTLISNDSRQFQLGWARERAEATKAVDGIRRICRAILQYEKNFGEDPASVEILIDLGYLNIPEQVRAEWGFTLIGNPIVQIEAVSTDEMPYGGGHIVLFDMIEGNYYGFHAPLSDPQEPLLVQENLGAIFNAIRMFRQDYREDPPTVEKLLELEYLKIPRHILERWSFGLIGANPVSQIEAVSTARMIEGAGHVMLFDLVTGFFSGYRLPWNEFYDWLWGGEWGHETLTMSVSFTPDEERRFESQITVVFDPSDDERRVLYIPLVGVGVLSAPEQPVELPSAFALNSACPNPFNGMVTVDFSVDLGVWTELSAYNLRGERVAWIFTGTPAPGKRRVVWNAADLPSGSYYLRLESAGRLAQQGVTLVK